MSEGALDLSISSYEVSAQRHHTSRAHDPVSSDSGRASSDSTSSDIHEDTKSRFRNSPPIRMSAAPLSSPSGGGGGGGVLHPPSNNGSGVSILSPQSDPSSNISRNSDRDNDTTPHHLGPALSPKSPVTFSSSSSSSSSSAHLRNLPLTHPSLQHLHHPHHHQQQQQHQHPTAPSPQQLPHTTFNRTRSASPPTFPRAASRGDSGRLSNPNSPEAASASSSLQEEDLKSLPQSSHLDRATAGGAGSSDPRVAPIRPFKMYPIDAFNVYNSPLLPGSGSAMSPTPVGIQSLYDSASPSGYPSFPLTPLTSHLLQRKRRAELRDNANNPTTTAITGVVGSVKSERGGGSPVATVNSSSPALGSTGVSTTLLAGEPPAKRASSVSSDGQEYETDADKKINLVPDERKDDAYWDRRRKNNEAAKRSRDARRQKEEEIAMRAAFLEQENLKLRAQVAILKNETAKLHYMLYNRI